MKHKKLPKQKMSRQKFKLLRQGELDEIMEKSMLEKYNKGGKRAKLGGGTHNTYSG